MIDGLVGYSGTCETELTIDGGLYMEFRGLNVEFRFVCSTYFLDSQDCSNSETIPKHVITPFNPLFPLCQSILPNFQVHDSQTSQPTILAFISEGFNVFALYLKYIY
jgi:hypothetical protein